MEEKTNRFIKNLLIVSVLLLLSWVIPQSHRVWMWLDEHTFTGLHSWMLSSDNSRVFWAIMDSRIGDWISQALFVILFLRYVLQEGRAYLGERIRRVGFIVVAIVLSILASKGAQSGVSQFVSIKRDSPSIIIGQEVSLTEYAPFQLNVKDSSRRSFPGDHAMTLILLTLFAFYFCGRAYGYTSLAIALFFILPRMIGGAHWLTDVVMGSFPIAALCYTFWMWVRGRTIEYMSEQGRKES